MNNVWQGQFPPFSIWLYGRMTRSQRSNLSLYSPADRWRIMEENLKEAPEPKNLIQKIVCMVVKARLEKLAEQYHQLDNMNIGLVGFIKKEKKKK